MDRGLVRGPQLVPQSESQPQVVTPDVGRISYSLPSTQTSPTLVQQRFAGKIARFLNIAMIEFWIIRV